MEDQKVKSKLTKKKILLIVGVVIFVLLSVGNSIMQLISFIWVIPAIFFVFRAKQSVLRKLLISLGMIILWIILLIIVIPLTTKVQTPVKPPQNNKQEPPISQTIQEVTAEVSFKDLEFTITNKGLKDWDSCHATLNNDYGYPGPSSSDKTGPVKVGESVSIPPGQFSKKDGTRFNLFTTKPLSLSLNCNNQTVSWSLTGAK